MVAAGDQAQYGIPAFDTRHEGDIVGIQTKVQLYQVFILPVWSLDRRELTETICFLP